MKRLLLIIPIIYTCGIAKSETVPNIQDYIPVMDINCVTVLGESVVFNDKALFSFFKSNDYKIFKSCNIDFISPKRELNSLNDDVKRYIESEVQRRIQESEVCNKSVVNNGN